jgi:hypothetical protein
MKCNFPDILFPTMDLIENIQNSEIYSILANMYSSHICESSVQILL